MIEYQKQPLALEYHSCLAIEFSQEEKTTSNSRIVQEDATATTTPVDARRIATKIKHCDKSNNYIMKLYGWSTWWSRVEKCLDKNNRHEQTAKLTDTPSMKDNGRKSQEEKKRFLKRYYQNYDENKCNEKKFCTEEKVPRSDFNGGGTPIKRLRKNDDYINGGNSSPFKKIRNKTEMSFGEGGDHSTDFSTDFSTDTDTPANWEY